MAKEKPVYKIVVTEGNRNIIQEYDIRSVEDIQEALKDLLAERSKK